MPKQKVNEKHLIDQAIRVFRRKGYNNTKMEDIAQACGLLKGSLYHYYSSKEALMIAVIEHMHKYYQKMGFLVRDDTSLSGQQKLQAIAEFAEEQFFASESGCLFGNLALETFGNEAALSALVKLFFAEWRDTLTHIFAERYPLDEAQIIALDTIADIEGAIMMMRILTATAHYSTAPTNACYKNGNKYHVYRNYRNTWHAQSTTIRRR
ncbi:MAG: TetR/AcrR family transcriptional regulator [Sphingobacteriales bacterium]|nr:TetR/AcrR family transcriptional regulator [Sphingobacteriales bacterium]